MTSDPKIPLKDPWLAGLLAVLVPGAGHLYQGRMFKGLLYLVCIWGMFFYGLNLGRWKVVYFRREPGNTTYGYFAQMVTGLAAWPAILQARRYHDPDNTSVTMLDEPLDEPFTGLMEIQTDGGDLRKAPITGRILLEPVEGPFGPEMRGQFTGTRRIEGGDSQPIELQLAGLELEKPVFADPDRALTSDVLAERNGEEQLVGQVAGVVPRGLSNWFEVPLEDDRPHHGPGLLREFLDRRRRLDNLQDLNGRLGKFYELALVYTWIAGLLNILAIWDACQGPAYGYREEERPAEELKNQKRGSRAEGPGPESARDPQPSTPDPPRAAEVSRPADGSENA